MMVARIKNIIVDSNMPLDRVGTVSSLRDQSIIYATKPILTGDYAPGRYSLYISKIFNSAMDINIEISNESRKIDNFIIDYSFLIAEYGDFMIEFEKEMDSLFDRITIGKRYRSGEEAMEIKFAELYYSRYIDLIKEVIPAIDANESFFRLIAKKIDKLFAPERSLYLNSVYGTSSNNSISFH